MDCSWRAAAIEEEVDTGPPTPEFWSPVTLPGRPKGMAGESAIAYRTVIDGTDLPPDAACSLRLHGGPGPATVWLDGERIARIDWPFRRQTVPLALGDDEHELVLVYEMPDGLAAGIYALDERLAEATVPGPWWTCEVSVVTEPHIEDMAVIPRLSDDTGLLEVTASVVAPTGHDGSLTVSVRPAEGRGPGTMDRADASIEPASQRRQVTTTVRIADPSRWSPASDAPSRYVVSAKVDDCRQATTAGFRTLDRRNGQLAVNGQPVTLRGFVRRPGDPVEATIDRAQSANANAIRVRGHVGPPALYEAASAAGILVWQDLPLAGDGVPSRDEQAGLLEALTEVLAGVPAIGLMSVHDEPVSIVDPPLGGGFIDRLRWRWRMARAGYDDTAASSLADDLTPIAPAIPAVGPPGVTDRGRSMYAGVSYARPDDVDTLIARTPTEAVVVGAPSARTPTLDAPIHASRPIGSSYQRRVVKTAIEAVRRVGADVVVRSLFDRADVTAWGVLDAAGDPKPAYDAVRASLQPVQAMLDPPFRTGSVEAWVVNDAADPIDGSLAVTTDAETTDLSVSVEANAVASVGSVSIPADTDTVTLALDSGAETIENRYRLSDGSE